MKIAINTLYSQPMKMMDYIANDFRPFEPNTTVSEARDFFRKFSFKHFAVVSDGKLSGVMSRDDIEEFPDEQQSLQNLHYLYRHFSLGAPDNIIELMSAFVQNDTDIVPVVDENNTYLGYYELEDVLHVLAHSPFFQQNSTTLVIEKEKKEYMLSEIAQIVESNNITLLGMFISGMNNNHVEITLKLNTEDVNEVIQSLRRYDYKVLTQNKDDLLIEQLKNRSEYLDKYLNI